MAMVYCRSCGAQLDETASSCPTCGAPHSVEPLSDGDYLGPRSFSKAISICLSNYAVWQGRAPRSEFWYWNLFTILIGFGAGILDSLWFADRFSLFEIIVNLAVLFPSISVQARRLHDLGKSGYWQLLWLLPIIGWIALVAWNCTRGDAGPNKHGPDPLETKIAPTPYQVAAG
jgi:uncharacterized membrane protein YhaH (DUF805 family)